MHHVAILVLENLVHLDFAIPHGFFSRARLANGRPAYKVSVCGPNRKIDCGGFNLQIMNGLRSLSVADTIIVAGIEDICYRPPKSVLKALQRANRRGARIASICSGAFVLAEAGLLDQLEATTHWLATGELAARFPKVKVNPDSLYIDNGEILTSAGAVAGIDLCLHLLRKDFGADFAANQARLAVTPLERSGGQSQFISRPAPSIEGASLNPLFRWIEANLSRPISIRNLSRRAAMSSRTLNRRFHEQTGLTPMGWIQHARLRFAQELLIRSDRSVEEISINAGYSSPVTMREQFRKVLKTSPRDYRAAFRAVA